MTLFRARVLDTPDNPFTGGALRADDDCGLLVEGGVVTARGPFGQLHRDNPDEGVLDLREGLVLPGLVDTHTHFPQVRVIGGLGMPLLDWLERCALPEEVRLADVERARGVARDFVTGLVDAGTTTALVFGAHFAPAVDALLGQGDTEPPLLDHRVPDLVAAAAPGVDDPPHGFGRRHAVEQLAGSLAERELIVVEIEVHTGPDPNRTDQGGPIGCG